jgi:hypothetical protein
LQATASVPRHHARAYRDFVEDARLAEQLGYDGVWLSEHHFFYDGYCPALLPAAASVLAATTRLRVGTGMLLAPMQHPQRLADAAVDLNRRSGGRLDLGLGLGYRDLEFDGKGVPRKTRVARHRAALDAVAERTPAPRLWIGSATPAGVARAGARAWASTSPPRTRCRWCATSPRRTARAGRAPGAPAVRRPRWPRCATCG